MLFSHKKPELISLHIPKTAGTSFRNILKSVYGDDQVVRFDINNRKGIRMNEEPYEEKHLPQVKVIHGHFFYDHLTKHFTLPENSKIITWVRDPVKRVISNYYYLESKLHEMVTEEQRLGTLVRLQRTLLEFARARRNTNRQVKFLSGRPLEDYHFIGIQELFNEEVVRLAGVLNWSQPPEVLHHNKTPSRESTISDEAINEIRELNMGDVELYNEALRIRKEKMNE